jgi:hypothetical protein
MMGHNPTTHHRHYGKWTDEAGLEEAVARAMGDYLPPNDFLKRESMPTHTFGMVSNAVTLTMQNSIATKSNGS